MAATSISRRVYLLVLLYLSCCICAFKKNSFSSKTSYEWTNEDVRNSEINEFSFTEFNGRTCQAVHISTLLRHGARHPGNEAATAMSHLHQKLKLTVTNPGFDFIKSWENYFMDAGEKTLVDAGEDEQYELGRRFGKRFLNLLQRDFKMIQFVSSSKPRSIDSAMSFYEGITDIVLGEAYDDMYPKIDDDLLRFHTQCEKYVTAVENNRTHMREYRKFKHSPYIKDLSKNLSERLGLKHVELDASELRILYFMCAFEMIVFEREDWCHLLTDEERQILEYHNDIKIYWKKLYGHPVIAEMTCPLVKALFSDMDTSIQKKRSGIRSSGNAGTFYFGHSETLAPVYAALGLFNDTSQLLASNYETMKERSFISSQVLQFSSNLALVLYVCPPDQGGEGTDFVNDNFAIRMFVNERPVVIPACGDTICPYLDVREEYSHLIDDCDFEHVCDVPMTRDEL